MLLALDAGRLGLPAADLTIALAAANLLRLWSRWLPGFATASAPFLLERFIRRPGRLYVDEQELTVAFDERPLDVVLTLAGYTAPLEQVPWLAQRRLSFRVERSP